MPRRHVARGRGKHRQSAISYSPNCPAIPAPSACRSTETARGDSYERWAAARGRGRHQEGYGRTAGTLSIGVIAWMMALTPSSFCILCNWDIRSCTDDFSRCDMHTGAAMRACQEAGRPPPSLNARATFSTLPRAFHTFAARRYLTAPPCLLHCILYTHTRLTPPLTRHMAARHLLLCILRLTYLHAATWAATLHHTHLPLLYTRTARKVPILKHKPHAPSPGAVRRPWHSPSTSSAIQFLFFRDLTQTPRVGRNVRAARRRKTANILLLAGYLLSSGISNYMALLNVVDALLRLRRLTRRSENKTRWQATLAARTGCAHTRILVAGAAWRGGRTSSQR